MGLDIRWPIGLLFMIVGLLLTGYGVVKPSDSISPGTDININLIWGLVVFGFGAAMLLGVLSRQKPGRK